MSEVTLGGERLGSGNRQKVWMRNYERSTHDLSKILRTTASPGTLVPFMHLVGLPGDTFNISLNVDAMTHPTVGPLFGSFKLQLDTFVVPMRLYNPRLHMNQIGIGLNMKEIKFPKVLLAGKSTMLNKEASLDNLHINPSSIFSYLGIRGVGASGGANPAYGVERKFNAIPYLAYWDIYKQYYANKQEETGAVIHKPLTASRAIIETATSVTALSRITITPSATIPPTGGYMNQVMDQGSYMIIQFERLDQGSTDASMITFDIKDRFGAETKVKLTDLYQLIEFNYSNLTITARNFVYGPLGTTIQWGNINQTQSGGAPALPKDTEPNIETFPLANIDNMRLNILRSLNPEYVINNQADAPYGLPLERYSTLQSDNFIQSTEFSQEGLALKTYNSDLFNNWINTDWIDGQDGITDITKLDTSKGYITIDELNLSKKVYIMLNRIALSGGTYDDWLDAVYTEDRIKTAENPIYVGGLIKNIVFEEVVSTVQASKDKPLGTLAGKGRLGSKHKGGEIDVKITEPSYIMGIFSITPIIDYSQSNTWDVNLDNMDDLHKPALDAIGFQELITEQMAWWDTQVDTATGEITTYSAGKVPAWINYMTDYNEVKGNFADIDNQMWMTLTRRYQTWWNQDTPEIQDLTTYIDPAKFNFIFADTRRDAQNFWIQIGMNIQARRKMSAKVIPNL